MRNWDGFVVSMMLYVLRCRVNRPSREAREHFGRHDCPLLMRFAEVGLLNRTWNGFSDLDSRAVLPFCCVGFYLNVTVEVMAERTCSDQAFTSISKPVFGCYDLL